MTDETLPAGIMDASPTFGFAWRYIADTYPESAPATLTDALLDLTGHIQLLLVKDRQRELGLVLAAVESAYKAGTPEQRGLLRHCLLKPLVDGC